MIIIIIIIIIIIVIIIINNNNNNDNNNYFNSNKNSDRVMMIEMIIIVICYVGVRRYQVYMHDDEKSVSPTDRWRCHQLCFISYTAHLKSTSN